MAKCSILDLVEDNVRNRVLAVFLVFACFCPLASLVLPAVEPYDSSAPRPAGMFSGDVGAAISAMCVEEAYCTENCSTTCRSALGFDLGSDSDPPSAPPSPMAPPPPKIPSEVEEEAQLAAQLAALVWLLLLLVIAAMVGNSMTCSKKLCVPFSLLMTIVLLVLIPFFSSTWSLMSVSWLVASVIVLLGYFAILVGMLLRQLRGEAGPGSFAARLTAEYPDERKEAYFAYVKNLLKDRNRSPAADALAEGIKTGRLTFAEREELEAQILAYESARFGLVANVKALFVRGERDEAVRVPARIIISLLVSAYFLVGLAISWVNLGASLKDRLLRFDEQYVGDLLELMDSVSPVMQDILGAAPDEEAGMRPMISSMSKHLVGAAHAAYAAFVTSAVVSLVFYVVVSVLMLGGFRASVLKARRGKWDFNPKKVAFVPAMNFVGGQIANTVFAFLLISLVLGLIVFILGWSLFWSLVKIIFETPELRNPLIALVGGLLGNMILKKLCIRQFEGKVKGKPFIKKRFGWMLCDFLQLFTQLLSGIFKAILRILMAIGLLLVASLRIDRSVFPAWVDELIVLDAMAKSYRSVVLLYHHHNNPIVHVFIRLAAEAAEERKAKALAGSRMAGEEPKSEADEVTARKRWVAANRWRKYAFMVLNPAVAAYRAVPPPPVEKKPSVLMKVLSKKSKTTDVTAKKDTMTPPEVDASKV